MTWLETVAAGLQTVPPAPGEVRHFLVPYRGLQAPAAPLLLQGVYEVRTCANPRGACRAWRFRVRDWRTVGTGPESLELTVVFLEPPA
jgi:hypothetical protein